MKNKLGLNNINIIFFILTIIVWLIINLIWIYNEQLFLVFWLLYIWDILWLTYKIILSKNKKNIKIIELIFSLIFCIWWPWLAFTWVGLWALNEILPWIIVTITIAYLLYYKLAWFYFIKNIVHNNYKRLMLLIFLNIIWTIWVFYFVIFFFL